MVEQWCEKQEYHHHDQTRKDAGESGHRPGLQIDGGSTERSRSRIALGKCASHVGQALTDEFPVGIKTLACFGRHGFGNGNGLHEPQKGDDDSKG